MCHNHVATLTYANNSDRNLDLNNIWFSCLHYILQYNFWNGLVSEKLRSLNWHLEKTQSNSMRPTAMIWSRYTNTTLNHDKVSIYCALLTPSVKAKAQVYVCASWGHLVLEMWRSTTRQSKQKICANLDHHWSKKCSFLCVQTNWVCLSEAQRFCKNGSVSSYWLWLESRHSVKNVTRVTIFLNVTRIESESPKITTRVESLTRVTLSLHFTQTKYFKIY